ncbi:MAG: UDP-N-acetylmuramoyl-tripeptide--D-alanyl-D-alanine ligase [Anaerolineae bacterium]
MLTLHDVLEGATGIRPTPQEWPDAPLSGVWVDSRLVQPGGVFVALRGEHQDGHAFVSDAFSRGARVALVSFWPVTELAYRQVEGRAIPSPPPAEQQGWPLCIRVPDTLLALQELAAFWRARFNVRVVGITGSVGKTTTKELTWSVLRRRFRTLRSEGNYNNEIGLPLTLLALEREHERVVLEMGMYQIGEIARLAEIARPSVGVVTNVGPSHLERLGSLERIAQAKAELVEALPPEGVAILNSDDPLVRPMAERTPARVFFYGLSPEADLWADAIQSFGLEGIRFRFHYRGEVIHVKVPLLGRHSVHTALRAAAVGLVEALTWEEIVSGLQDVSAQLRLVAVPGPNGSRILDDTYNASPASNLAALNLLEELEGRRIAVLGDMLELGEFEVEGHCKVGRRAADVVAKLLTVGPRARIIGEEALRSGMQAQDVQSVSNNEEAIQVLLEWVQPGDVILVKGSRGMRMEQIVMALGKA